MSNPIQAGNYGRCPHCGSDRLIKSGKSHFADGPRQRYECRDCRRFTTKPLQQLKLIKSEDVPL